MKKILKILFLFNFILFGSISCLNSNASNDSQTQDTMQQEIQFVEERRDNRAVDLPEVTIVNNMKHLTEIYSKLQDPSLRRSAPIPPFDEASETMLVIKPKLKKIQYGDIEIESIRGKENTLIINYREIENQENIENKLTNPVVILKVTAKPKMVNLKQYN